MTENLLSTSVLGDYFPLGNDYLCLCAYADHILTGSCDSAFRNTVVKISCASFHPTLRKLREPVFNRLDFRTVDYV